MQGGVTRVGALDSLRGVAAFVVAFTHAVSYWPGLFSLNSPHDLVAGGAGPGRLLFWIVIDPGARGGGGRSMVMLFFVLSGFVLALPFVAGRPPGYGAFLVRRICRIYLPFAAAIAGAALIHATAPAFDGPGLPPTQPISLTVIARHLAMTGIHGDNFLDHPMWSLVHEMRISIIFPLLCMVVLGIRLRAALPLALLVFLAGSAMYRHLLDGIVLSLVETARFVLFFVVGIGLAQAYARHRLLPWAVPVWCRVVLWLVALIAMLPLWWHVSATGADLSYCAGAALVIALSLTSTTAQQVLAFRPIAWLGRVSYSVYLVHAPLIYLCVATLGDRLPFWAVLLIIAALVGIVSELGYRYVEAPAIALGRRLTGGAALRPRMSPTG